MLFVHLLPTYGYKQTYYEAENRCKCHPRQSDSPNPPTNKPYTPNPSSVFNQFLINKRRKSGKILNTTKITREMFDHCGTSLGKQGSAGFMFRHTTLTVYVALATGFVSRGSHTGAKQTKSWISAMSIVHA